MLRRSAAQLVLYDAGVDVFRDDKLGWLQLSHAGIWQRDLAVLDACAAAGVPVATVIGGGYDDDRTALARRHALVVRAAALVCRRHGLGVPMEGMGRPTPAPRRREAEVRAEDGGNEMVTRS